MSWLFPNWSLPARAAIAGNTNTPGIVDNIDDDDDDEFKFDEHHHDSAVGGILDDSHHQRQGGGVVLHDGMLLNGGGIDIPECPDENFGEVENNNNNIDINNNKPQLFQSAFASPEADPLRYAPASSSSAPTNGTEEEEETTLLQAQQQRQLEEERQHQQHQQDQDQQLEQPSKSSKVSSSSLSSSTTHATDAITKMMVELWGNREQAGSFPPEETSAALTQNIDQVVAKELYEMKRDDREAIFDELHGVKSRAVPETPQLIESALRAFEQELQLLDDHNHQQDGNDEKDTDINGIIFALNQGHIRATSTSLNSNYVTAPEFRIRFLRVEFFEVKKAVIRYCKNLNYVWALFGDIALVRQICLSDLSKQEIKYLKGGQVQCLMSRDRMGRRMFAVFGIYDAPIRERMRVELYLSFVAIADDETTQINGATNLCFFSLHEKSVIKFDRDERNIITKMIQCAPVRYTASHFCMPDERIYYFFKAIVHSLLPPVMRASMRVHTGSHLECNYALCQFGVPVDDIPKSATGTIKSKSIQKFIKARTAIEKYRTQRCELLNVQYVTKAMEEALVASPSPSPSFQQQQLQMLQGFPPSCPGTDCPELDCIVFGDRVTYKHPPNVQFRDYLRGKRHRQEQRKLQQRQQQQKEKKHKERMFDARFLDEIIDEASKTYRFATYDKDIGWYAYISANQNRNELRKKISQLMRDERKRDDRKCTSGASTKLAVVALSGQIKANGNGNGNAAAVAAVVDIDISYYPSSNMGIDTKRFKKNCGGARSCGGRDSGCFQ